MKMQIACFTAAGAALAEQIKQSHIRTVFEEISVRSFQKSMKNETEISLHEWVKQGFREKNALLFVGACGIAVRSIAPYIKNKLTDPPVLVADEKGQFVIPLLSSHIGGAGELAGKLAAITGGIPVLTTASDVNKTFAADVFARENGLFITDLRKAKETAAAAAAGKEIYVYYPKDNKRLSEYLKGLEQAGINGLHKIEYSELNREEWEKMPENSVVVSPFVFAVGSDHENELCKLKLQLVPRSVILGMGCRKGKTGQELLAFITDTLEELGIRKEAACCIASVDIKQNEPGLWQAAEKLQVPFCVYTPEVLALQQGDFSSSDFVKERTGVDNVCERAAVAAGAKRLLAGKRSRDGMTIAVGISE